MNLLAYVCTGSDHVTSCETFVPIHGKFPTQSAFYTSFLLHASGSEVSILSFANGNKCDVTELEMTGVV